MTHIDSQTKTVKFKLPTWGHILAVGQILELVGCEMFCLK